MIVSHITKPFANVLAVQEAKGGFLFITDPMVLGSRLKNLKFMESIASLVVLPVDLLLVGVLMRFVSVSAGIPPAEFYEDREYWKSAVRNYWSLLTPLIFSDHPKRPGDEDPIPPYNMLRNVMDMNAHYGGLNAALSDGKKSAWVMNVVPAGFHNTLALILNQGFAGVLHDW